MNTTKPPKGMTAPLGWGAPERITLDHLMSWSAHPDERVKYFSGTATYRRSIEIPASMVGPSPTVLLAAVSLRERINRVQVAGVAVALVAANLLSV